jgi:outer membrane protein assembly factor BamB
LQADAYEEEFSGYTMSSDKQSLYVSGTMNTSLDFGCGAMTTSGGLHAPYLAKLDSSNGSCVWSSNFPSSGNQIQFDGGLVVKDNQVFLTGRYSNDIDFGSSVTLSTSQGVDGFLAAFSDDGTPSWATSFGGSGSEEPRGLLAIDSSTFIVTGDFGTTMAVSDKSLVSNGGLDGFFGLIARP